MSVKRVSRAFDGTFQLTPPPKKTPFFDWTVSPTVARVMFSASDSSGEMVPSVPTIRDPVIVALSLDGTYAFFATSTGIEKVRTSDNGTVESFDIGGLATHLRLLPDGLTLVATTGTTLYVIDL